LALPSIGTKRKEPIGKKVICVGNANSSSVEVNFNSNITLTQFSTANYEGFKSSGKIGQIENKTLKRQILKYYQDLTTGINSFEKIRGDNMQKIFTYIQENSEKQGSKILLNGTFKHSVKLHIDFSEGILKGYDAAIGEANSMLKNIDAVEK
jgi:hypothetical protein